MINLYPVTLSNIGLWIIILAFVGTALWNIFPLLFKRFVPEGYKHDKGLDAMVRECPSLAHPSDKYPENRWKPLGTYDDPKKIEQENKEQKLPRGWKKHDGGKCPVKNYTMVRVWFLGGEEGGEYYNRASIWEWKWPAGNPSLYSIIGYKVKKATPKKGTKTPKKATKKPAKQPAKKVTMSKKKAKK